MKEAFSRSQAAVRRGSKALLSPAGLRGAVVETAWTATHVAFYPLGLLRERLKDGPDRYTLDGLPPVQRGLLLGDVEAAGTPIVLVHGWVDNRSIFTVLRRALQRRGFGRVVTMNYSVFTYDIPRAARRLGQLIEQVCAETGYERVHVVGHSMGGLVARYYVQRLGGDERVHTLATLGAPHSGTRAAHLMVGRAVKQLRPGSELLAELAAPALGCRTRVISVWSDIDHMVVPKSSARLDHPDLSARNVLIRGVGHLSLPIDGRVVFEIVSAFAHLDEAGTTIAAGVTQISGAEDSPPARVRRTLRRPRTEQAL